jgi:hypothetical protein
MRSKREPGIIAPDGRNSATNGARQMWEGGPLRQFSDTQRGGHYIAYSSAILTGYAGSYVCDRCRRPSVGVYLSHPSETENEWLCGGCKKRKHVSEAVL